LTVKASGKYNLNSIVLDGSAIPMLRERLAERIKRVWQSAKERKRQGIGVNLLSLAPGFSRVVCAADEGNGFNRFPRASKPLKRLSHRQHLFTGLKPGANERSHQIASARTAEAKEFGN